MPTNKVPFTFNIENAYLNEIRRIAKRETRSVSNLLEHLCKLYIKKDEQSSGGPRPGNESRPSAKGTEYAPVV